MRWTPAVDSGALLSVRDLCIAFRGAPAPAVRGTGFDLARGEAMALVGESGSGKSVTALSILDLLPPGARVEGSIRFQGRELRGAPEGELRRVRGNRIAMVFQEPMTSLNPLHTVERQVAEVLALHKGLTGPAARARVLELLDRVGLADAAGRLSAFPHELSGGQRQRVMIAMALANEPDLLIADEPTTALDVTVQAQILTLLDDLRRQTGMALLLITHDLGIVRRMADRVCVMKDGEMVEQAPTPTLFTAPAHPYTRRLLAAEPAGGPPPPPPGAAELLRVEDLRVWYPVRGGLFQRPTRHVKAVDGVSLALKAGHTLGIVGESGSGKTTLGQAVLRLVDSRGAIRLDGRDIQGLGPAALRPLRREMGIVFQDPFGSLSPRLTVGDIVGEGLRIHGIGSRGDRAGRVATALAEVGLDPAVAGRYPHEFSGGQRQRISIARALVMTPRLIVLDEPTSALDRSVQVQIVELLRGLQARHGLAYLFISHDLRIVRAMAHDIMVMRNGVVVEAGPAEPVFAAPQHEYTRKLLSAALMNTPYEQ